MCRFLRSRSNGVVVRVLHCHVFGQSRSKSFQLNLSDSYEPLPGESLPHRSRTSAEGGKIPTTFAHLRCGMSTKIWVRRRRKVCRVSRLRVPQACVAEARKLHVSRSWVHQEVLRLHVRVGEEGRSVGRRGLSRLMLLFRANGDNKTREVNTRKLVKTRGGVCMGKESRPIVGGLPVLSS